MAGQRSAAQHQTGQDPFLKIVFMLSTLAGWVAAGMIILAVGITCQMIFVRFVLNESTIWQTEAVIYLIISATLIGLSYVQSVRGHVNVDLIPLMLPKKLRFVLAIVTLTISIMILFSLLLYGYEYWHLAWSRGWKSDTVWGVRLWIPYLSMPIGFALFALQLIADLYAVIIKVDKPFGLEDE